MGLFLSIAFFIGILIILIRTVRDFRGKVSEEGKLPIVGGVAFMVVLLGVLFFMGYHEYNLLYNYIWVEGKLINECDTKGPGPAYEYEYYLDGKRYTNCNNAGNTKLIKCPGGKYKVRVSRAVPSGGRIDFEEQILE